MRKLSLSGPRAAALLAGLATLAWSAFVAVGLYPAATATQSEVVDLLASRPLSFETNRGQGPADATFLARRAGFSATFAADGFRVRAGDELTAAVSFVAARGDARSRASEPDGVVSYLRGSDPRAWIGSAPRHRRIGFEEIYPGVDVEYYTREGELEYDFILAPEADPSAIRMSVSDGRMSVSGGPPSLTAEGELRFETAGGAFTLRRPVAYQQIADARRTVEARYALAADGSIGFELGDYDRSRPLVIDPRVGLSSYLGGSSSESVRAVRFTSDGSVWVAGSTSSPDYPLPENAFPLELGGGSDVFLTKLERGENPLGETGWRITATVFLGGAAEDRVVDLAFDAEGKIYVFGDTRSADFPVSDDAEQPLLGGAADLFLTVLEESDFPFFGLSEEGSVGQSGPSNYEIVYSTFVGGVNDDFAEQGFLGPFAEGSACAALVGLTDSPNFPVGVFASQLAKSGGADGTLSVICRDPSAGGDFRTVYSTFFGGRREESQASGGVTEDGAFCLAVRTASDDLPAENGLQPEAGGNNDAYFACFTPVRRRFGLPFLYRDLGQTYFGGEADERLAGILVERSGPPVGLDPSVRVYAVLSSTAEILEPPPPTPPPGGPPDPPELPEIPVGASATNPGSRSLLFIAFDGFFKERLTQFWFGGSTAEEANGIAKLGDCIAVVGRSSSADFPVSESFPQRVAAGGTDALAAKFCFDEDMNAAAEYMGLYGSPVDDEAFAVALSPEGDEIVVGGVDAAGAALTAEASVFQGQGPGFPVVAGAPQVAFGGGAGEGFVLELFRPRLSDEGVLGAADFRGGAVAPGQILSLFGSNFGAEGLIAGQPDEQGRFPRQLGTTRVLFNDSPAALIAVAKDQVNVVAPFFLDGRSTVELRVEVDGAASRALTMAVVPVAPAVFTLDQSGSGQGAVLNQDFSVNGPRNAATGGSVIQVFLTGTGQTNPPGVDSEITPLSAPFPALRGDVLVRIAGVEAIVLYAGGAPGLTNGVAQINVLVPRDLPRDAATPLQIAVGGISIQPGVTVAIR